MRAEGGTKRNWRGARRGNFLRIWWIVTKKFTAQTELRRGVLFTMVFG